MNIYIWGTGFAAKELLENELAELKFETFIDNDKNKTAMNIRGGGKKCNFTGRSVN